MKKMKEEWYVGVRKKFQEDLGEKGYFNAISWYPNHKSGQRYASSEEEAKAILNHAYRLWNKEHVYGADGKRYENSTAGMLGISVECDKKTDDAQRIVSYVIKRRKVTDWTVTDEM